MLPAVTVPELVAGLHQMDLTRGFIDQDGDTFEFHATRLIAVVTQFFSYTVILEIALTSAH